VLSFRVGLDSLSASTTTGTTSRPTRPAASTSTS